MRVSNPVSVVLAVLWLGVLTGCVSSPRTSFYTLASMPDAAAPAVPVGRPITVGVGPVTVPNYVDRPELVLRTSPYSVSLMSFDQWAEPLANMFPQVLVQNVARQLPGDGVIFFPPLVRQPIDVQIPVNVIQFDADPSGSATLIAEWRVLDAQGRALTSGRSTKVATTAASGTPAQVSALSQTVADLSGDLAQAVWSVRSRIDVPASR